MYNMRISFIAIMDDAVGVAHSSSDELLDSEDESDESSSPCSSGSSIGVGVVFFSCPSCCGWGRFGLEHLDQLKIL